MAADTSGIFVAGQEMPYNEKRERNTRWRSYPVVRFFHTHAILPTFNESQHTLFCRHRAFRCIAYFLSYLCVKIDSKKWKHETGVNWTSSLDLKTSSVSFSFFPRRCYSWLCFCVPLYFQFYLGVLFSFCSFFFSFGIISGFDAIHLRLSFRYVSMYTMNNKIFNIMNVRNKRVNKKLKIKKLKVNLPDLTEQ